VAAPDTRRAWTMAQFKPGRGRMASLARMPGRRQNTPICRHQQTGGKEQPVTQNGGYLRVTACQR
jgi:hypothetical protein